MGRLSLDRDKYDHPEHFDDEIRAYKSSARYLPTPLENLLFELAGHRCTICHAPWLEIHHIEELSCGGTTEFENLIVLCPNCHTRVHKDGVPSKEELKHYKLKQEIAYELPVLSRLSEAERLFLRKIAGMPLDRWSVFSERICRDVPAKDQDEAIEILRNDIGLFSLYGHSILAVELENVCTRVEPDTVHVAMRVRLTGKGIKWLKYLVEANRIPQ